MDNIVTVAQISVAVMNAGPCPDPICATMPVAVAALTPTG
jgi:hypothetical protein